MLEKISGDEQQGPAGVQLDEPFVVSVLDQNGSAIAGGAVVTFSVIAGGGTLSVETATADASGQAATRLTLGRDPGPNSIEVTVAGLEPVTFTATAIEQTPHSLEKVSGDSQEGPASTQLSRAVCRFGVGSRRLTPCRGVRHLFGDRRRRAAVVHHRYQPLYC